MNFDKRVLGSALLGLIVLTGSIINMMLNHNKTDYNCQSMPSSWEPTTVAYTIVNHSPKFELLKTFENIYSWRPLYLSGNNVYLVGGLDRSENQQLLNFNIESGRLNWQMCETEAMVMNQDRVYAGYTDFAGAFVIVVDAVTGEEIWHTKVDHRVISNIQVSSIGLLVTTNDHGDKRYYLVDAETGEMKRAFPDYLAKNEFLIDSGQTIYQLTPQGLSATGNVNWEIDFAYMPSRPKITTTLIDNILLIEVIGHSINQIYAVDNPNGKILWQTERNVKSNLAIDHSVGYFLTRDSVLKAVDLFTGTIIGEVSFFPRLDTMPSLDYVNMHPYLTADNNIIVVYFDNSRQLFTFQFSR